MLLVKSYNAFYISNFLSSLFQIIRNVKIYDKYYLDFLFENISTNFRIWIFFTFVKI